MRGWCYYYCWSAAVSLSAPRSVTAFVPRALLRQRPAAASFSTTRLHHDTMPMTQPHTLRVGLCQFPGTPDRAHNHATCRNFVQQAVDQGAQFLVLPEIWASPYATAAFPDYAETLPKMGATDVSMSSSAQLLQQMAQTHKIWIVGGSLAERHGDKVYNTCLVFDPDGVVVAKHRKVHLFDIDVPGGITFTESDTLSAGNTITSFTTPWGQVGLGICYDLRFTGYAAALRQHHHCRILVYPGAFNLTTGPAHWELLQRARAVDTQCYVLTASQSRLPEAPTTEDNPTTSTTTGTRKYPYYAAWGHSSVTSPWGQVVATTNETPSVVVTDLDLDLIDQTRQAIPIGKQARTDLYQVTTTTSADSSRKATA